MIKHPRQLLLGFAGGLGAAAILPFLTPILSQTARPLAKVLLKQAFLAMERLRTWVAQSSESVEDLIAEARAEVEQELNPEPPTAGAISPDSDSDSSDATEAPPGTSSRRETLS